MGGLLLSLGAMIIILQAKKAFAPAFHEISDERTPVIISPGGGVRVWYNEEPGHFLPPGFPTVLVISKKNPDGGFHPMLRLSYNNLVDKEVVAGPLTEEGDYHLEASLHICAAPGVADCTRYLVTQPIRVKASGVSKETVLNIDLRKLAEAGLAAGKINEIKK